MTAGEEAQLSSTCEGRLGIESRLVLEFWWRGAAWLLFVEAEPVSDGGSLSAAGHAELGQDA